MSTITVKNIPGIDANFDFTSPLNLEPGSPFPEAAFTSGGGAIPIASFDIKTDKQFTVGDAKEIKFGIAADVNAGLGVYRDTAKLLTDLSLSDQLKSLLNLKIAAGDNLLALRWGYDFKGSLDGKLALVSKANPVKLNFGASGEKFGRSIILHAVKQTDTVLDTLTETFASWRLPRQVTSLDKLPAKTTIIYETRGNLNLSLGVEYGYNFNWTRDALTLGNLSGDLAMKIDLGLKAQFGFSAVGSYALVLSRESDTTIRVQVFNAKKDGLSFSFDGGVGVQATKQTLLPANLDDFIKGVFNVHGAQVLKDFQTWTDPTTTIKDLLGKNLEQYAKDFVHKVTGIDTDVEMKKALDAMKELIADWHKLPQEITSYLYALIGSKFDIAGDTPDDKAKVAAKVSGELTKLTDFLNKFVALSGDDAKLTAEITSHLKDAEFFATPVGKWLTAAAQKEILSFLVNIKDEKAEVKKYAEDTLALIKEGDVRTRLLALQKEIDDRLGLDKIANLNPDEWLKQRLADFLNLPDVSKVMARLDEIRAAIKATKDKADDFYKKGYAALMKKYSFDLHYAFQKSTADSALVDITFDFSGDAAEAEKYLAETLDGNFENVLADTSIKCLTINQAVLTHEIKRNTHLEVNIPYFGLTLDHINNSVAGGKYVEEADDKLWVYYVNAEDIVSDRKSVSRLAIATEFTDKTGVRQFEDPNKQNNELNYTFAYGKSNVDRKYIEMRFNIAARKYLQSALPPATNSFSAYLGDMDKFLDANGYPGSDNFGTVLASFKVSFPGSIMQAWNSVPEDFDAQFYSSLSVAVQRRLREWIPLNFIQNADQYKKTDELFPLLVYMSMPPMVKKMDKGVFYWNFTDKDTIQSVFNNPTLVDNLHKVLQNLEPPTDDVRYQDTNDNIVAIRQFVLNKERDRFGSLCGLEDGLIRNIVKTAKAFQKFKNETDPRKKIKALADFGSKFTDTFNDEIGHIDYIPKGALRPVGLLLFLEIARLLMPDLDETKFAAMFEIFVLPADTVDAKFNDLRKKFLAGQMKEDDAKWVLRQHIVNVDGV